MTLFGREHAHHAAASTPARREVIEVTRVTGLPSPSRGTPGSARFSARITRNQLEPASV